MQATGRSRNHFTGLSGTEHQNERCIDFAALPVGERFQHAGGAHYSVIIRVVVNARLLLNHATVYSLTVATSIVPNAIFNLSS